MLMFLPLCGLLTITFEFRVIMAMELKCSSTKLVLHICPIFHYISSKLLPSCPVMILGSIFGLKLLTYFQLWMLWMCMVMKGVV